MSVCHWHWGDHLDIFKQPKIFWLSRNSRKIRECESLNSYEQRRTRNKRFHIKRLKPRSKISPNIKLEEKNRIGSLWSFSEVIEQSWPLLISSGFSDWLESIRRLVSFFLYYLIIIVASISLGYFKWKFG